MSIQMKVRYQIMNRQSKIETFFLENTKCQRFVTYS